MSTHPVEKELKTPGIPPGTKIGPMGLPVSYNRKDYKLSGKTTGSASPKRQG